MAKEIIIIISTVKIVCCCCWLLLLTEFLHRLSFPSCLCLLSWTFWKWALGEYINSLASLIVCYIYIFDLITITSNVVVYFSNNNCGDLEVLFKERQFGSLIQKNSEKLFLWRVSICSFALFLLFIHLHWQPTSNSKESFLCRVWRRLMWHWRKYQKLSSSQLSCYLFVKYRKSKCTL